MGCVTHERHLLMVKVFSSKPTKIKGSPSAVGLAAMHACGQGHGWLCGEQRPGLGHSEPGLAPGQKPGGGTCLPLHTPPSVNPDEENPGDGCLPKRSHWLHFLRLVVFRGDFTSFLRGLNVPSQWTCTVSAMKSESLLTCRAGMGSQASQPLGFSRARGGFPNETLPSL